MAKRCETCHQSYPDHLDACPHCEATVNLLPGESAPEDEVVDIDWTAVQDDSKVQKGAGTPPPQPASAGEPAADPGAETSRRPSRSRPATMLAKPDELAAMGDAKPPAEPAHAVPDVPELVEEPAGDPNHPPSGYIGEDLLDLDEAAAGGDSAVRLGGEEVLDLDDASASGGKRDAPEIGEPSSGAVASALLDEDDEASTFQARAGEGADVDLAAAAEPDEPASGGVQHIGE